MVKRMRNALIYFLCSMLVVQLLFPTSSEKASASVAADAILGMRIVKKPIFAQDNSRPRPFNGRTGTNHACLGIKQAGKSTYEVSYCIDYALGAWTNDYLTSDYKNMTDAQKLLLNYTLLYGFNSPVVSFSKMSESDINNFFATQTLVWIIREGYFYKDAEREKIEKFLVDDMFGESRKIYDVLYEKVKYSALAPSYATETRTTENIKLMKWNATNKRYEITLTNTYKNGVYSANNTITVDETTLPKGVKAEVSGENIIIYSTEAIPNVSTIRLVKKSGIKGKVVAWRNSVTTRQSMVTLDYDEDPIEKECFVNIQTEAFSTIKVVTKSTDNIVKDIVYNVNSDVYSDTKAYTTDDKGLVNIVQVEPGTYNITQVQNSLSEYLEVAPQKVTIGSNETKTVIFNRIRKKIRVDITKLYDDVEGNTLKDGSEYGVYKDGVELNKVCIKDGKGVTDYSFYDANAIYTVKEIKASTGAELDETTYTLDTTNVKNSKEENNTVYVKYTGKTIKNDVVVNLKLEKNYTDAEDVPGVGIDYTATNKSTGRVHNGKTDEKGQVVFTDLPYGIYVIDQVKAPVGYIKDGAIEVDITNSNEGAYIYNQYDKIIKGAVEITKTLELSEYEKACGNGTKYGKDIKFVANMIVNGEVNTSISLQSKHTDEKGITSIDNLTYGTWVINEVVDTVPNGYDVMAAITVEIKENGQVIKKAVENKLIRGKVSIIDVLEKTDMDYMSGDKYAEGIKFVAKPVIDGVVKDEGAIEFDPTNAEGKTGVQNIGFGDWQVSQVVDSIPTGYIIMDPINIAITKDSKDVIINVLNLAMKGKVFVSVYDKINKKPISGCKVEIYNANGDKVFNGNTDEAGDISTMVNYGKYTYKVVNVPKEYVAYTEIGEFAIVSNNQTVEEKVYLDRVKGILNIIKVTDGNKRLPGTEYALYSKDGTELDRYLTDEKGELTMGPLEYGDYYFLETKAPSGYKPDKTKYEFTITEDGQVLSKVLKGEIIALTPVQNEPETMDEKAKEVIELKEEKIAMDDTPKTGDNSKMRTFMKNAIASGATIILMIVTEIIQRKKKARA